MRPLTPPLGLLYLSRALMVKGYEVKIFDCMAKGYSKKAAESLIKDVDIVGITLQSFNRSIVRRILIDIKKLSPELPLIVGGPDCILHNKPFPPADVAVTSEAEEIIVPIVESILCKGDLSEISGVIFKDRKSGGYRWGLSPGVPENLDEIKFPAREIMDYSGYDMLGRHITPKMATIMSTRGCPFSCSFCARGAVAYGRYRERSVENVLDEIEEIYNSGYKFLAFVDEEFLFKQQRVKCIMRGIIKRNMKMRMLVQGRVTSADEEMFSLMREAGVRVVVLGLESGNQDTLDFYHKGTTVDQNARAVEMADNFNLFSFGFFILGAPMETEKHLENTIQLAMKLPLDGATFNILDYTYGSRLWQDAFNKGLIESHEFNVPTDSKRGLGNFPREELEKLCLESFDKFYKRPSLWARWLRKVTMLKDPWMSHFLFRIGLRLARDLLG